MPKLDIYIPFSGFKSEAHWNPIKEELLLVLKEKGREMKEEYIEDVLYLKGFTDEYVSKYADLLSMEVIGLIDDPFDFEDVKFIPAGIGMGAYTSKNAKIKAKICEYEFCCAHKIMSENGVRFNVGNSWGSFNEKEAESIIERILSNRYGNGWESRIVNSMRESGDLKKMISERVQGAK